MEKDSREDYYEECEQHHETIHNIVITLDTYRSELNKLLKKERRNFYLFIFAAIGAAAALVAIYSFLCPPSSPA